MKRNKGPQDTHRSEDWGDDKEQRRARRKRDRERGYKRVSDDEEEFTHRRRVRDYRYEDDLEE